MTAAINLTNDRWNLASVEVVPVRPNEPPAVGGGVSPDARAVFSSRPRILLQMGAPCALQAFKSASDDPRALSYGGAPRHTRYCGRSLLRDFGECRSCRRSAGVGGRQRHDYDATVHDIGAWRAAGRVRRF